MTASLPVRLAAQIWVGAFVALLGTYLLTTIDGLRVPVQVLYATPLAAWAVVTLRGPRDLLDIAVLVAVAAHVGVALAGVDPTGSLEAAGLSLGFAVMFWLMRSAADDTDLRSMISLAAALPMVGWLLAAAVAWIFEKVSWVAAGGGWPPLESYQVFVWGTTNAYPVLVILTAPLVAFIRPGRARRAVGIAFGAAAVIVVPLSVGRAGWLGIAVAIIAYEALSGWARLRFVAASARHSRRAIFAAGLVGTAALVGLVLASGRLASAIGSNLDTRERIWNQALGIFGTDPVTGSGPGTFSWVRLQHVPPYEDPIGVILAHNAWLQTIADGGLVLGVAFGALAVLWLSTVWRQRSELTRPQCLAAAAVIGLAAASLLDDFSFLPAVMAVAVTLAAWSVPVRRHTDPSPVPSLLLAAVAVLVIVAIPAFSVERARLLASDARRAAIAGQWKEAARLFEDAAAGHPTNPLLHLGHGLALAELGRTGDARGAYEQARTLSPGDPRAGGALAALADEPETAVALLEGAARVSTDAQYALRLAAVRSAMGDRVGAADAYAMAVFLRTDLYRSISDGATGVSSEEVRGALAAVAARAHAADPNRPQVVDWDLGLADGDLGADAPATWQAIASAVSGDEDAARSWVLQAKALRPHDQLTHLAAASVAWYACDEDGYRRAMTLAGRVFGTPVPTLAIGRDPIYRDFGLGDYQPSWVDRPPPPPVWPFGLVPAPTCEWAP